MRGKSGTWPARMVRARAGIAAAAPTAPQPVCFRAGLRTRARIVATGPNRAGAPSRAGIASDASHSGGCAGLARLPLRGQCRTGLAASPASRFNPVANAARVTRKRG